MFSKTLIVNMFVALFILFASTAHARPQVSTTASFTMADVQSKGYTVLSGKVYDLQSQWAGLHRGGAPAIQGLKGIDGTMALQNKHGISYISSVSQYQVGILSTGAAPSQTAGLVPAGSGSFKASATRTRRTIRASATRTRRANGTSTARLRSKNTANKVTNNAEQPGLEELDGEDD
jgi:hypothetical protein